MPAVAEHRAIVGELGDLGHAVRDVDDGEAVLAQPLQHLEDAGDVGGGERGGRLVEDQQPGMAGQRLGDLHHLAARQRQACDRRRRVDVLRTGPRQRFGGDAALGAAVDESPFARRVDDADIVGDAQMRHQRQFLEDRGDAGGGGIARMREPRLAAVEDHLPLIRLNNPGEDLDQRRLSRAVLTEHGMDASGMAGEIHLAQRLHAAETLRDSGHRQDRFGGCPKRRDWLRHGRSQA